MIRTKKHGKYNVCRYSGELEEWKTLNLGAGAYIKKPYDIDTIGKVVREEPDKKDKR
ncbi:MAG: hypothetical protein IIA58_00635 [Candidatus Marinimicrobia bacterium]|nr:hypothetical protein [Candidatus Neomarinimicrobiota bacterium]